MPKAETRDSQPLRTAVVTGAGSGIGAATAAVLSRAGYRCVIVGRTRETLEQTRAAIGGVAQPPEVCAADVTQDSGRRCVLAHCRDRYGGIDALVNCATVTALEPLLDYSEKSWREVLAINLDACFFLAQLAIEDMRSRAWGRIVNIGSVYGEVVLDNRLYRGILATDERGRGPVREVAYAAAKGAIRQLTKELAVTCAPWGITVNTIVPGMFPADRDVPEPMRSRILERIPLGRFGLPEEIGHAVEFVVSDRAAYVTGSELVVDGGWTAW
jgi:NAD(P)-dependent dehydrogenase (short-subunit alcohol dehydrogenase family)